MAAAYTINRIPNTSLSNISPFETLYGSKPDLSHFRVFGSTGYLRIVDCKRTKWDSKANKCIFLGYSETSKAYRVWDLVNEQLVITRSVKLNERPPLRYKDVVVIREPISHCNHSHDERDELNVNVPHTKKNQEVEVMDIDETADNQHRW